ncbi:HAD-IIA family hydrolase, partial [Aminivibrio sp.]|uniref:HAD-IIA family hydrolase n=1 Tax=Aminivibrio sp. TaxID=1872489 RepID=UPI0025B7F48F
KPKRKKSKGVSPVIADLFDCFFFDLDGVLYVGGEATPGAAESLDTLRSMGKTVRFLTNNPTTRVRIADRLRGHGIAADMDEIVTAGSATAKYLAEQGITRAWVIGESGLHKEVEMAGILAAGEKDCEALVLGWDETATLAMVRRAALAVRNGALFVATNIDRTFPTAEGPVAGVGALVEAIRTGSGRDPVVVGKPFPPMFAEAIDSAGFPRERTVMVGDTPDVDILGAHRAGISAILMGEALHSGEGDFRRPDGYISSLPDLFSPAGTCGRWSLPRTE